jgi:hypothetical protein
MMKLKIYFGGVIFKNASLLSYNICFEFQNVHLHIMEITVNSCVPVDLVLLAVILVVDVFVVVPGREITVTWMLTSVL